jgi:hypothetical protein
MMMKDNATRKVLWAVVLLAPLLLAAPAWTAGQQESVAWRVSTGGMDWSILIPENGSVLTVGGNGVHYQKVFKAGERPHFTPSDIEGNLLDGTYKWEIRIAPRGIEPVDESGLNNGREESPSASRQLPARARIERQQLKDSLVRSGAFTVLNGGIIDPNQIEPGAGPTNTQTPGGVQK